MLSNWEFLLRAYGVTLDGRAFEACDKPDCDRVVPKGMEYCCTPCAVAAGGAYEIHEHSAGCDERWAERRPLVMAALANVPW